MENILENVRAYFHGKMNFAAGICKKLKVSEIIEKSLSKSNGRKPDISYGTLAEMMIVNLCDSHKPLYLIQEYYEQKYKYVLRFDIYKDTVKIQDALEEAKS
ncbi:DUF4277 domain-containing protein [Clostridium sp. AWRP]|uniref:DUF4277 domain-containing protein n=1 Tax=Clostridium sp. AWRP TaxID=2212991 RepID=UPI000FDBE462|nr:DUF4277 domain-containing protein [Clostridium sp. AWRP]AZV57649.1 DUF4277 domain-containing protein [Clostridium sp. AWRP]